MTTKNTKSSKTTLELKKIAAKVSLDVDSLTTLTRNYSSAHSAKIDDVLDDINAGKLVYRDDGLHQAGETWEDAPTGPNESDPLDFLDIIHTQSSSKNAVKSNTQVKAAPSSNTLPNVFFLHLTGNREGQTGTFDQTTIVGPTGEIFGHAMINMSRAKKYYCTHCLGTIELHMAEQHVFKCFFETGSGVPPFYCSCCNARCGNRESYIAHVNSPVHTARMAFIKELVKKPAFFIDNDGVSYATVSNTAKSADKFTVSTEHLHYRINSTLEFSKQYLLSDGAKLFKLMSSLISNKEKGNDDIGSSLVQKNAIIKAFNMYRAEVNIGFQLCHPPSNIDDFICVVNCATALKELNYDVVNNSNVDETIKKSRRAKIDEIFQVKEVTNGNGTTRTVDCKICNSVHPMRRYVNAAAIDKTITMTLSKLN